MVSFCSKSAKNEKDKFFYVAENFSPKNIMCTTKTQYKHDQNFQ